MQKNEKFLLSLFSSLKKRIISDHYQAWLAILEKGLRSGVEVEVLERDCYVFFIGITM